MKSFHCVSAIFVLILSTAAAMAPAQEQRGASGTKSGHFGESDPAAEWVVWRSFYKLLQHPGQSPGTTHSLLVDQVGVSSETAQSLLELGAKYREEIAQLELLGGVNVPRAATGSTSQSNTPALLKPPVQRRAPTAGELEERSRSAPIAISGQIGSPKLGTDESTRASSVAAYEEAASSILDEHKRQVKAIIGGNELGKVEAWIVGHLAYQVRVTRPK
jgi:hypothetical protein